MQYRLRTALTHAAVKVGISQYQHIRAGGYLCLFLALKCLRIRSHSLDRQWQSHLEKAGRTSLLMRIHKLIGTNIAQEFLLPIRATDPSLVEIGDTI